MRRKVLLELKTSEMDELIQLFFKNPEEVKAFFHDENQIVLSALSKSFQEEGLDLMTFTPSFLFKGVINHYLSLIENLGTFKNYLNSLEKGPFRLEILYNSMNLHSSSFFQNPDMYEELKTTLLPQLIQEDQKDFKVLILGCGSGEEAYSFLLVIYDFMMELGKDIKLTFYAKDTHSKTIKENILKQGRFPLEYKKQIPEKYHKYLTFEKGELKILSEVSSQLIFSTSDFLKGLNLFGTDMAVIQNTLPFF